MFIPLWAISAIVFVIGFLLVQIWFLSDRERRLKRIIRKLEVVEEKHLRENGSDDGGDFEGRG
jgi:hypothetical protein